jgi:hypothetical protein
MPLAKTRAPRQLLLGLQPLAGTKLIGVSANLGLVLPASSRTPEMYAGSLLPFTTRVGKFVALMERPLMNALKKYRPAVDGEVT